MQNLTGSSATSLIKSSRGFLRGERHRYQLCIESMLSGVDCCPIDSGGADEPHRGRSFYAAVSGGTVCVREVFLKCAGGKSALTWRNGACMMAAGKAWNRC